MRPTSGINTISIHHPDLIVPPLDIDEKGGDDDHERKDAAEESDPVLRVVGRER